MAGYDIRKYKDCDYEAVRAMFADGMLEHLPATRMLLLKNPAIHVFLLGVFLAVFVVLRSYLISAIAVVIVFTAGRLYLDFEFQGYIQQSFREDLLDIHKSYMQREGACFWVADSGGEVVGMVAAQPPQKPTGEAVVELRRMSVGKNCRGQGIGKALCRTVIAFAREHGKQAVILETSFVQYAAHKLYENVGFRKLHGQIYPSLLGKLIKFNILCYRYDITRS